MKEKIVTFFKTLPTKLRDYFKDYFKNLNYPFFVTMVVLSIGLLLADYFSKHQAFYYLTDGNLNSPTVVSSRAGTSIIPGVLDLTYTANLGAAWGFASGKMWALCIVSFIASIMLTVNLLFRFDKYNKWMTIGITLMAPGAIGNLIDRMGCLTQSGIYKGGVIDFLHFTFWPSFPICNLADYFLTIGVVFLIIGFVLEFKKEYKQMKLEEEAEKKAEAEKAASGVAEENDFKKKLAEKEQQETGDKNESESNGN